MAKPKITGAGGEKARAPPPLPNRDVFHRVNFAYQSAAFLQQLVPGSISRSGPNAGSSCKVRPGKKASGKKGRKPKEGVAREAAAIVKTEERGAEQAGSVEWDRLARKGTKEMKRMAVHTQVRLDPSIKRAICQTCSTLLIPGLTCKVRNRPSKTHMHVTHYTCLTCQSLRSIPNPPLTPSIPLTETSTSASDTGGKRKKPMRAAFHERELVLSAGPGGSAVDEGAKGHGLWRGEKALSGWGAVPPQEDQPEQATE